MGTSVEKQAVISFLVAAVLGAAIWGFSPVMTGEAEPWDGESSYYLVTLLCVGVLVGSLWPRRILPAFIGIVVGQLIYMLVFRPLGPLWLVGVVFLVSYGLVSLLGLLLASAVRRFGRGADGT